MATDSTPSRDDQAFDPAVYCPEQVPDADCLDRGPEEPPESRFVLLRSGGRRSLVISEEDRRIWKLCDGKRTVNDICERYLSQHRTLVLTRVYSLIQRLWQHHFLTSAPHISPVREAPPFWLWRLNPTGWLRLPVPGSHLLARLLGLAFRPLPLHNLGGMIVVAALIVLGLIAFGNLPDQAQYPLLKISSSYLVPIFGEVRESYLTGLLLLVILHLLFSFLHALAKGAMEAAETRHESPLSIQLNYGVPVFSYPARWAVMLPQRRRLLVQAAGLILELFLAAIGSMVLFISAPRGWSSELIYTGTCMLYLRAFLHLSPLPGSAFPEILCSLSNVSRFRERALGFFRHSFTRALSGDINLAVEHKFYIAFNLISVFWLGLAAVFSLALLTTNISVVSNLSYVFNHAQDLQQMAASNELTDAAHELLILAEARYLLAALFLLFVCLILTSLGLAVAWAFYVLGRYLQNQAILQRPTFLVTAGLSLVIVVLAGLIFLVQQNLLQVQHGMQLLHGLTYVVGLGGALFVAYRIKHLGRSWLGAKFASLCLAVLGTTLSLYFEVHLPGNHQPVVILQSLTLAMLAVAMVTSFGSRLHLGAFRGTDLFLPELAILMGGIVTAVGAVRAIGGQAHIISGAVDNNRFVGISLILLGIFVTHRVLRRFEVSLDSLAVDLSKDDEARALKRIIAFVLEAVSRLVSSKFGEEALSAMEGRINKGRDSLEFTFASIHVQEDCSADEIGRIYAERFQMVHRVIATIYGERLADDVFDRSFGLLHWECKDIANHYLFPGSTWEGKYQEKPELDGLKRSRLVENISIFKELSGNERQLLVRHSTACQFAAGELIVEQGQDGETCYILVKGEVQVEERGSTGDTCIVAFLHDGDFFGESALLTDAPRLASVRATTDCQLLAISRHDFSRFADRHSEMVHRVRDRLYNLRALLNIPLFGDLTPSLLRVVLPRIRAAHYEPGDDIITQGDTGKEMYLIKSGTVEVLIRQGEQEATICELGPTEYFGEIALLREIPRTATVRSISRTELLVLDKQDFLALADQSRLFAQTMEIIGSRRLRNG